VVLYRQLSDTGATSTQQGRDEAMHLTISYLYPSLMSQYGDRGNLAEVGRAGEG
jgi:hypothetical protein